MDFNVANTEPEERGVTIHDPYSIEPVRRKFNVYEDQVKNMTTDAAKMEVKDDETNGRAVAMAGQSKQIFNAIEKLRKEIIDQPNQFIKAINNFAKIYTQKLKEIENGLKVKISRYQVEQERKRRVAEEAAKREAAKLQKKLVKEAKKTGETPIQMPVPVMQSAPKVTRTESGSASIRKVWTWKMADGAKVPAEYIVLDSIKINKAVKAGVRNIPGLEIYEESQTVVRV